tara:strand:- start:15 stop:704 length:690 start_codon:yes stop_codon:yes gene_type:complete
MNTIHQEMPNYFNREELDDLKAIHKITMDQIILDTKPKKEFRNWKTKISRLINKKGNDPSNFGYLELSEMLSDYFNKRNVVKEKLSATHFIGKQAAICSCGELDPDGVVRIFEPNKTWRLRVDAKYSALNAVYIRHGAFAGFVRLFKRKDNFIDPNAEHRFSVVKQKKTNEIFWGFLKPLATPRRYSVTDHSIVSGQKVKDIATNIEIAASAPFLHSFKPNNADWIEPK